MNIKNFSFDGQAIEFELSVPFIVLIDPIALDGLSAELKAICNLPIMDRPEKIRCLPGFLRVGVQQVEGFRPGKYRLGNEDVEETGEAGLLGAFDIDSGAICVVDLNYLGQAATALTWERYDSFLRSPRGDDSIWMQITNEIGGSFFGMLNGDVSTPFQGDGRYKLTIGAPHATTQ